MKIKYIDTPGVVYMKMKLNEDKDKLGFFSSKDDLLIFEVEVGPEEDYTLEEAEKLDGRCSVMVEDQFGVKLSDVTEAYYELPDSSLELPKRKLIVAP